MDGQEVKLHSVEIRLEAQTVRNYLNFATKYTGGEKNQNASLSPRYSVLYW